MKHLGDITKINGAEIEPVWCITGGSPCQDLSVAGKRAGLAGARSSLFMEQVRVVKEMRENDKRNGRMGRFIRPRFLVWENVPGAFSSNGGDDFRAVLEEVVRIVETDFSLPRLPDKQKWTKAGAIDGDGWSIAWRTHDAQYWGVPQRRRRIALVADFGGQRAGEILFEREGLPGDFEQGEPTQEEAAGNSGDGVAVNDRMAYGFCAKASAGAGSVGFQKECGATLQAGSCAFQMGTVAYTLDGRNGVVNEEKSGALQAKENGGFSYNCVNPVAYTMQAIGEYADKEVGSSCKQRDYKDATDLVCEPKCYGISSFDSNAMKSPNLNSGTYEADTSRTLDLNGGNPACNQGGVAVCERTTFAETRFFNWQQDDKSVTLHEKGASYGGGSEVLRCERKIRWIVRRLTPTECERLQGFPDGWTDIGEWTDSKGKKRKPSDTPRYKALGNSIALPFWYWMFCRMAKHLPDGATLGSLFDGIGGFPLCWEVIHGKGTAVWSSEIEEFPIAVTKMRFGN